MQMFIRVLKFLALALLLLALLGLGDDVLRLNPAQRVALPYRYSLLGWEIGNLPDKWVHRVATAFPWSSLSATERRAAVSEYFRLGGEINALRAELEGAVAQTQGAAAASVERIEAELQQLRDSRKSLRNDVEEVLEAAISDVVVEEGISSWGELVLPPVDIRLGQPPRLLVTSPRDRIFRADDVLLSSDVNLRESEEMERALMEDWDLSGLVTGIGGVATYPASIVNTLSLQGTLRLASHEWVHHFLFFRPLGMNIYSSPEMQTLNETFSEIAEREIGDRAFEKLGGEPDPVPSSTEVEPTDAPEKPEQEDGRFDFDSEMRATRRRVDELLAQGAIEKAEAYMEERRQLFVANDHNIRKLNQAYFALHGTYAESPASVSPIADQLHEFHALMPDLKTFLNTMAKMSRYQQFLDTLDRLKVDSGH